MLQFNYKKYGFLSLAILISFFSSCKNEDSELEIFDPSIHIGFNPPAVSISAPEVSDMNTKSVVYTKSLPVGAEFGVLGYCSSNAQNPTANWTTKYQFLSPNVFNESPQKVTFDGGSCVYDNLKYWIDNNANRPEGALHTFFAYYPFSSNNEGGFSIGSIEIDNSGNKTFSTDKKEGAPALKYKVPRKIENEILSNDAAEDAMISAVYDHQKVSGNIGFNFSHLMTAIRFKVNNYDDDTPVIIEELKLNGTFYGSVILDYTPIKDDYLNKTQENLEILTDPDDTYTGTFNILNNIGTFTTDGGYSKIIGDGTNPDGVTLLLLPYINGNKTSEEDDKIGTLGTGLGLNCKYEFQNGILEGGEKRVEAFNTTFKPGCRYTINLNFIGDSFTLNITTENLWSVDDNWNDGGNNNIQIQ